MRAAGLQAIHTIMTSQAVLIKSNQTARGEVRQQLIDLITSRIRGVVAANRYVLYQYNINRTRLTEALTITPGRHFATVSPLDDTGWAGVSVMVFKNGGAEAMAKLQALGVCDIFLLFLLGLLGLFKAGLGSQDYDADLIHLLRPSGKLPSLTS